MGNQHPEIAMKIGLFREHHRSEVDLQLFTPENLLIQTGKVSGIRSNQIDYIRVFSCKCRMAPCLLVFSSQLHQWRELKAGFVFAE